MSVGNLMPSLRLRIDAEPSDVAAALQQHRAPLRDAIVSVFDEYVPPAVKPLGLT